MAAQTSSSDANKGGLSSYFRGVKSEFKKVIWPGKKEIITYTGVVIMMSAIVSLIVYVLDLVLHGALGFII